MAESLPTVDGLADELLEALRDHPAGLLSVEMFNRDGGRLQAAYNRLYCELHDKSSPTAKAEPEVGSDGRIKPFRCDSCGAEVTTAECGICHPAEQQIDPVEVLPRGEGGNDESL